MARFPVYLMMAFMVALCVTACGKKADTNTTTTTTTTEASSVPETSGAPEATESALTAESPSPLESQPAPTAADATVESSPAARAAAAPAVRVSFTDIRGDFGEQEIRDEAALGILDATTGAFKPNDPVTRTQFVRWLVKANNIYAMGVASKQIRLARTGPASFVDVPVSNPDFQYVQGLANAGYVVGIDGRHFAPNLPLTREQMIAVKASVDEGGDLKTTRAGYTRLFLKQYSDVDKIQDRYVEAVNEDQSVRTTRNIARVWGSLKTLFPQKAVTRSEAAIALWEIGAGSAPAALGRSAPPPPQ